MSHRTVPIPALEVGSLHPLLQQLPLPLLLVESQRIVFANEAAARLLGDQAALLLGRSPWELFHPDSIEKAQARLDSLVAGAAALPAVEETIQRADGGSRCVQMTAARAVAGERVVQLIFMHDVTELRWTREALLRSQAELRRLAAARQAAQETERRRLGRLLHDDLLQPLAALRMELGTMEQQAQTPRLAGGAALTNAGELANVGDLARTAMETARDVIDDLQPLMLEELGLGAALEALTRRFGLRTGLQCSFQGTGAIDTQLDRETALCVYRITQELLLNVERHARARKVDVWLAAGRRRLLLRVRDDGVGLPETDHVHPGAFGLLDIRERLRVLGGTLKIAGKPRQGTRAEASIPARRGAHSHHTTAMAY